MTLQARVIDDTYDGLQVGIEVLLVVEDEVADEGTLAIDESAGGLDGFEVVCFANGQVIGMLLCLGLQVEEAGLGGQGEVQDGQTDHSLV